MNNLPNVSVSPHETTTRFSRLRGLLKAFANSPERVRTRRLLGQLDEQQRSDLGISQADLFAELDKPFWR
ncbi:MULTISPECIES: DUF1127 domain-containing protein [unclassified Pseudomonas]|uniref:DUF1127 domain-containing protein n=1 Tax=unclassified Pseudomonas TaxID=196821 RepID=UPI002AC98AF2|nr:MULTISPECIES: DUF1127 domain-containing protein [unclassified Pseudomonas]MEB0046032.1 DUF1127 domain-containing protein [Pseudomonas sp. Dout3]MEB0097292.1 DUF1127 domain-containing protein [Pseudomonas sp. DC1.2]WPX59085.1 DUF1127 domain-containing protein [Pseudomonas sp. DC1.2]